MDSISIKGFSSSNRKLPLAEVLSENLLDVKPSL